MSAAIYDESAEDLYENAPCGYLSVQLDGTLVKVNQTFLSWTGYRRDDLVGHRRFVDLLTTGSRIFHETHYAPLLRMQEAVREIAVDILCADGRRLPVLINSVVKKDAADQPLLIRTTVFNATDRKEYERELVRERRRAEQATRAREDFISVVSVEIKNQLNAIAGVGHLLAATGLDAKQQELVDVLRTSSESLLSLVNDILDFSKIEAGKVALEERSVDLRRQAGEIAGSFRAKARERGLGLEVRIDERVPPNLLGDPVKIGQILTNLVGNAVKFTAAGEVTVALRAEEVTPDSASIGFRIADTGIGIEADRLPHIFDDFTQVSYDIGLKYGGTGLGLAIVKRLVELHGSRIAVESEPGRGTAFSFSLRLKVAPSDPADQTTVAATERAGRLRGLKALVVDDNEVNVLVLTAFLQSWGVEVGVATDGRQAVERVEEGEYDLVLMDLRMPELDGYAATRRIRSLPGERFARLPILAFSASTRMGHQHELEAAGFTDFVGKPIDPDVLFAKI